MSNHINSPMVDAAMHATPAVTYTTATATVLFWGLHISDIAVILSAFATLCSVGLQFFVVISKLNNLEQKVIKVDKVIAVAEKHIDNLERKD